LYIQRSVTTNDVVIGVQRLVFSANCCFRSKLIWRH